MTFSKKFFLSHPLEVARALIGAKLTTINKGIQTSGMITEVEAYASDDEASHSFRGPTRRNQAMFLEGGYCYVYLIYGVHYCVNVVTEKQGTGSAVLIRALMPLTGIDHMQKRRGTQNIQNLTSGPGKVCQALSINKSFDGENLKTSSKISLVRFKSFSDSEIFYSRRIGISKAIENKWRICLKNQGICE